jgi:hypothetical protein
MTSEITNKDGKTGVTAIVVDKLLDWRNTIKEATANTKLAISKENLRKFLQLSGIWSQQNKRLTY